MHIKQVFFSKTIFQKGFKMINKQEKKELRKIFFEKRLEAYWFESDFWNRLYTQYVGVMFTQHYELPRKCDLVTPTHRCE